ncbi:hypothetical protein OCS_03279 [Ophiocordyceps sinensis CO18]|uniref:Uncharacterized protein n=1 Tax=Ophiocordyceps sinensis (strain Co18 / CGMCC 3.14243) TaxID=911162 RepID=T5A6A5_OPHSC|nr:hypothetical protein OCS_03279 [Ophiocordyceps sinensis CO18]
MSGEDLVAECVIQVVWRCLFTGITILINRHLVSRREAVTRHGRRLQQLLRIPEYLHVFSDSDPGILDGDIIFGVQWLIAAGLSSASGAALALLGAPLWHPSVLGFGLVVPSCVVGIIWLMLAHTNRVRSRERVPPLDLESGKIPPRRLSTEKAGCSQDKDQRDVVLEQALRTLWKL